MKKILQKIIFTPQQWSRLAKEASVIFSFAWLMSSPFLAYKVFSLPYDYLQQEHVRMLFVHVPCALLSLTCYSAQAIGAFIYLIWPIKPLMRLVLSAHLPTLFLVFQTLVSGSLWGYPTWGTWWAWDARLTSELVLFVMMLFQLAILNSPLKDKKKITRYYALCLVIGWLDIPIVHFSVQWWNTLHQGYSLSWTSASSIDPVYYYPLIACIVNQIFWLVAIVAKRYKLYEHFLSHNTSSQFPERFLQPQSQGHTPR